MIRLRRRYGKMIYSRDKPPIKILFWNICHSEQLQRELVRWLDKNIPEGERIRSIKRLDVVRG